MGYKKPKSHLHREFLYINHDTIVNSLSALEAGKIDEIIQKANAAREGGFAGGIGAGPLDLSASKKKSTNIEEEMVRTRTIFSAFDVWYKYLEAGDAIGSFDVWNQSVRDSLAVGDTIEFEARLRLTPIHLVFRTFLSFAEAANTPGSVFQQKGQDLQETKKSAQNMNSMLGGKDAMKHLPVYMEPLGIATPRVIARLDEQYVISPKEGIEGTYRVIAQVDQVLAVGEEVSAIRIIRDVPPTPIEMSVISEALQNFIEPAEGLGVHIAESDITLPYPAVVLRPIAVYR